MGSSTNNFQEHRDSPDKIKHTADLGQLPLNQRTVMNIILGPREMPYKALCDALLTLPDETRLTQSQIDGTLYELVKLGYLTSFFEGGDIIYMVQLTSSHRPSKRDEQRLWNKFDMGLEALDINLAGLGLDRFKTPGKSDTASGAHRFQIPGLTPKPPRKTPTPAPKAGPGLFKFNLESLLDSLPIEKPKSSPQAASLAPEVAAAPQAASLAPEVAAAPQAASLAPATAALAAAPRLDELTPALLTRPLFHRLPLLRAD